MTDIKCMSWFFMLEDLSGLLASWILNSVWITHSWYLTDWLLYKWLTICVSTYRKVPVVRRLDIELWGCKVKISQNIVPKSILRFHILWNLHYLILELLEEFGVKTVLSCQNEPLNCQNTITLYRFPIVLEPFSQNQLFANLLWHPQ